MNKSLIQYFLAQKFCRAFLRTLWILPKLWCFVTEQCSPQFSLIVICSQNLKLAVILIHLLHHMNFRISAACHGPYLSGSSLHGVPPLTIHSIPFNALRLSHFARRLRFPSFGCSGGSISFLGSIHFLWTYIVSFPYERFKWLLRFVQLLFFKQALVPPFNSKYIFSIQGRPTPTLWP